MRWSLLVVVACAGCLKAEDSLLNETLGDSFPEILDDANENFAIYESYYPLMCLINTFDANETRKLEKYLKKRTYAELKRMIDSKLINETDLLATLEEETSGWGSGEAVEEEINSEMANSHSLEYIQAYHNATIYSIMRAIWNTELGQALPPFDQIAILEYFAERRNEELLRETFLQRIWRAIRRIFQEDMEDPAVMEGRDCAPERPMCVKHFVASLSTEERARLAQMLAVETEDTVTRDAAARAFVESRLDSAAGDELRAWAAAVAALPEPLVHILDNATSAERRGLQRLREKELLHAMKDYYRAMIERKKPMEQEARRFPT